MKLQPEAKHDKKTLKSLKVSDRYVMMIINDAMIYFPS